MIYWHFPLHARQDLVLNLYRKWVYLRRGRNLFALDRYPRYANKKLILSLVGLKENSFLIFAQLLVIRSSYWQQSSQVLVDSALCSSVHLLEHFQSELYFHSSFDSTLGKAICGRQVRAVSALPQQWEHYQHRSIA